MNQKGEVTLLSCLLILVFSSLVFLCGLELSRSFNMLKKRTHLFLCVKESKGEFHRFMTIMGRTNWAIKNINRASLIMVFIPGLQGIALDAQKAKKYLQYFQNALIISYVKTLNEIRNKRCPLDPRMFITPFQLGSTVLKRDTEGAAILREKKWTYYYFSKPYLLNLTINPEGFERINPRITYVSEEKGAILSSLYSSH